MRFINPNLTPSSPKKAVLGDLLFEIFEFMKDDNAEKSPSFRALLQQSPRYRRDLLTFLRLKAIEERERVMLGDFVNYSNEFSRGCVRSVWRDEGA